MLVFALSYPHSFRVGYQSLGSEHYDYETTSLVRGLCSISSAQGLKSEAKRHEIWTREALADIFLQTNINPARNHLPSVMRE